MSSRYDSCLNSNSFLSSSNNFKSHHKGNSLRGRTGVQDNFVHILYANLLRCKE